MVRASEIMQRHGWHDVWVPNKRAWFVGNWTGPEFDMLCLTYCRTNRQGRRFLSPEGKTLTDALRLAQAKLLRMVGPKKAYSCGIEYKGLRCSSRPRLSRNSGGSLPKNHVPLRNPGARKRG